MHSFRFTSILFICLLTPLVLRLMGLEPYPAILFPSGPETIKQARGKTEIETKQLYAKNQNGQWQLVEPKTFMYPASAIQLAKLVSKNMGFKKSKQLPFKGKIAIINFLYRSQQYSEKATEEAELRDWIKTRLMRGNYQTSVIKVAVHTNIISTNNGNILQKQLKYENYYNLDFPQ